MSAEAATLVLPRRRKRRPPTREERWAIGLLLLSVGICVREVICYTTGVWLSIYGPQHAAMWERGLCAAACVIWATIARFRWWPMVWNYIRHGYRDE